MTEKPVIQANSSSLSKALKTNADSAVILRYAMRLSISNLLKKKEDYNDLLFEIKSTQKSIKFWEQAVNFKNKESHIKSIKTRLEQQFNQLKQLDHLPLMLELRQQDEQGLKKSLQLLIISLLKYYQTSEQIPVEMIGLIADRIIWKFGGLSLEDIAVCFNMAMNGDLGKVYNRIDGGVIMSWLQSYSQRQEEVIYAKNVGQHANSKGSTYKDYNEHRKLVPERLQIPTELREKRARAKNFNKRNG